MAVVKKSRGLIVDYVSVGLMGLTIDSMGLTIDSDCVAEPNYDIPGDSNFALVASYIS